MSEQLNTTSEQQQSSKLIIHNDSLGRHDYDHALELAPSLNEERSNAALMRAAAHAIDNHPEQGYDEFQADYERMQEAHLMQLTEGLKAGELPAEEFKRLVRAVFSESIDLDEAPYYDLKVARLVLQQHPTPASGRNIARELSSLSWGLDRATDAKEAKLEESLKDSQDRNTSEFGSPANKPERLKDIDVTYFVSAMDNLIGDESMPNRVSRTSHPRTGETLTEVIVRGSGATMELSKSSEPAGDREIDPSRIVALYHMVTEVDGTRVEIHVHDGVLASAAYVDYKNQENTDRTTSRRTYDRAVSIFDLAADDLQSQANES